MFQLCSIFANFKNIWTILENLSHEKNNLNFDISFSMEHVGLTEQLFG